jgi:ankyrin repeat protein
MPYVELVRLLLCRGADVDGAGMEANPLSIAHLRGNVEIVDLFLDWGAKVNYCTFWNAVSDGDERVVKLMLDNGADANSLEGYEVWDSEIRERMMKILGTLKDYGANYKFVPFSTRRAPFPKLGSSRAWKLERQS